MMIKRPRWISILSTVCRNDQIPVVHKTVSLLEKSWLWRCWEQEYNKMFKNFASFHYYKKKSHHFPAVCWHDSDSFFLWDEKFWSIIFSFVPSLWEKSHDYDSFFLTFLFFFKQIRFGLEKNEMMVKWVLCGNCSLKWCIHFPDVYSDIYLCFVKQWRLIPFLHLK